LTDYLYLSDSQQLHSDVLRFLIKCRNSIGDECNESAHKAAINVTRD
jgi:hypothetical protein